MGLFTLSFQPVILYASLPLTYTLIHYLPTTSSTIYYWSKLVPTSTLSYNACYLVCLGPQAEVISPYLLSPPYSGACLQDLLVASPNRKMPTHALKPGLPHHF